MRTSQVINFCFTILSVSVVAFSLFIDVNTELYRLAHLYDSAFCFYFFIDFLINLLSASNKKDYLFKDLGLLDLLSAIPVVTEIRFLRIFRIVRLIKVYFSFQSIKIYVNRNIYQAFYVSVYLVLSYVIVITSFFVLHFEQVNGNIKTAGDTLWWVLITVTTVGYGDYFPITPQGKLFATLLILCGFIAFGTFISFINNKLSRLGREKNN